MSVVSRHGAGRPRYERLLRLPSARTAAVTIVVTAVATVAAAVGGPVWSAPGVLACGAATLIGYLWYHRYRFAVERHLARSLVRSCGGRVHAVLPELTDDVRAEELDTGVTRLHAASWLDAVRAAGFVMARDRGFQMDLLRRTAAGELAEVLGRAALPGDRYQRRIGLAAAADRAAAVLDRPERELLTAFSQGVNAAWDRLGPPFECRFLSYAPRPWDVRDSLLIALSMFHTLSWKEQRKRADAVIREVLPRSVARFFLADEQPPPPDLARFRSAGSAPAGLVVVDRPVAGSNCWAVRGTGAPLLACDLHLPLTAPNVLYELDLRWPGGQLRGLAVTGIPVVLTGTNGRLIWGVTDLAADVLDLVRVDSNAATVVTRTEQIPVRGAAPEPIELASVDGMPVSAEPLLGERVAVRWTGQDPRAGDLRLQRLAHAVSAEEGVALIDAAGGIALNVLVADDTGRLAHLASGLLPRRAAGTATDMLADGYLTGAERPRIVDPSSGILVSANDAALPTRRFRIGYDVDPGHRARRIRAVLTELAEPGPAEMRMLQHDPTAELYRSYQRLALGALAGRDDLVARLLAGWDGRAGLDSRAFSILVRFRAVLAERLLAPYLLSCLERDPTFVYTPSFIDAPVLALAAAQDPALLPPDRELLGWPAFIAGCVDEAVGQLRATGPGRRPPRWGRLNRCGLGHPLTPLVRWAGGLLDVAAVAQSGALHCVRTSAPGFGAAGRAVLAPAEEPLAWFEVPGGQSGHPLSRHYSDRHRSWAADGGSRPWRPPQVTSTYVLRRAPVAPGAGRRQATSALSQEER